MKSYFDEFFPVLDTRGMLFSKSFVNFSSGSCTVSKMLAPIMTKDMKLFPSRPLPPKVKNVRSRAQSLQDFAHSNGTINNARVVPARQRNAQSVGNIPSVSNKVRIENWL